MLHESVLIICFVFYGQLHSILQACPVNNIVLAVKDRPLCRSVVLHKDRAGRLGIQAQTQHIKHRRRIKTEEKAVVVAAVWGEKFIQFLAALAVFS